MVHCRIMEGVGGARAVLSAATLLSGAVSLSNNYECMQSSIDVLDCVSAVNTKDCFRARW